LRSHLDQVEIELAGDVKGLGKGLDAELLPLCGYEANLASPDAIVDPGLIGGRCGYAASLLWIRRMICPRKRRTSGKQRPPRRSIDPALQHLAVRTGGGAVSR
jgi:hypothetical protein